MINIKVDECVSKCRADGDKEDLLCDAVCVVVTVYNILKNDKNCDAETLRTFDLFCKKGLYASKEIELAEVDNERLANEVINLRKGNKQDG